MISQYFSRIYFSRYFYSSFKCTLKTRIKITRKEEIYFYSDPYYFNINMKTKFKSSPVSSPFRAYFFPLYFRLDNSEKIYDLAWGRFFVPYDWHVRFFSLFVKLKAVNFFSFNFIKIYSILFFRIFKLW